MYRKQYGECAKWHWAFWIETFGNSEKYGLGNGMFHFYSVSPLYGWADSYHLNFFCNPLKKMSYHPNFLINPLKGVGASLFSWCRDWPFLVSMNHDVLKKCSVNIDWSELCETWTARILDCVHIHWRSIEENISLIGQMTLASIWGLDLTSLLSLHTSVGV